jgi:hypothetical protein
MYVSMSLFVFVFTLNNKMNTIAVSKINKISFIFHYHIFLFELLFVYLIYNLKIIDMQLQFRVKQFNSKRKTNSITDMLTRQQNGTYNIQYRILNTGRYQTLNNKSFKSIESANEFINETLMKNSILYVKGIRFKNTTASRSEQLYLNRI